MNIGDKVIVKFNPHHTGADQIIGVVKGIHPQAGVGGCDLVDVEYVNPGNGQTYKYPFGRHNLLESGSAADFQKLAGHYEALASFCKHMAQSLSRKTK